MTAAARGVTADAHGRRRRAEHLVGGVHDLVIAVTRDALREPELLECGPVWAREEEVLVDRMALAADHRDRVRPGREGAVVAVAIVARGCAHVALYEKELTVDAPLVL